MTQNQITYWATGGTLLGAVRNGGLIPWDDDIDVCILEGDEEKLKQLDASLDEVGLSLHYCPKEYYKIYKKDGDLIPDEENALVLTAGGYIKRTNPDEFRKQ